MGKNMGFPGGSVGKEFTCHEGDPTPIPGLGRSCNKNKRTIKSWKNMFATYMTNKG